ncbi:hypothetical protein F4819DRAFT_486023 [Hypoxylon fuscum]|nr:hypothetical protein F4819DRAFT_486023 [Hypoxylon fuscum]
MGLRAVFIGNDLDELGVTVRVTVAVAFAVIGDMTPDDSRKAIEDSSRLLSPSLSIAIYDPTLTPAEALENDYTRLVLVNANGMVAVNLGLNYRQVRGKSPAYDYDLSLSSIPTLDMRCDNGSDKEAATGPCFLCL